MAKDHKGAVAIHDAARSASLIMSKFKRLDETARAMQAGETLQCLDVVGSTQGLSIQISDGKSLVQIEDGQFAVRVATPKAAEE